MLFTVRLEVGSPTVKVKTKQRQKMCQSVEFPGMELDVLSMERQWTAVTVFAE